MPFTPAYITLPPKEKKAYQFSVARVVVISLLLFILLAGCLYLHHTTFRALESDLAATEKKNSSWIVGELGYFLPFLTVCLFQFAVYAKNDHCNGIAQKEMAWEILLSTLLVYAVLLPVVLNISHDQLVKQLALGDVLQKNEGNEYVTLFLSVAEWFIRLPVPMLLLYVFHHTKAAHEMTSPPEDAQEPSVCESSENVSEVLTSPSAASDTE